MIKRKTLKYIRVRHFMASLRASAFSYRAHTERSAVGTQSNVFERICHNNQANASFLLAFNCSMGLKNVPRKILYGINSNLSVFSVPCL